MTFVCRIIWILPIVLACAGLSSAGLKTKHEWKYVDYVWENDKQKQDAIHMGVYNYATIVIFDHQPLPDGRQVITTPKFSNNPATLSIVSNKIGDGGPLLAPYPDWSWHKASGDCSGITSVNRAVIDKCNRLWIVDSGTIADERVCPAKILAFDLKNDRLVKEFQLSDDLMRSPYNNYKGLLEVQIVESSADACDTYWVYIADGRSYGVVIYDGMDAWRIDEKVFFPTKQGSQFSIAGENFTLEVGPSAFLITPDGFLKEPYMIFKSLSTFESYAATLRELHSSKCGNEVNLYVSNYTATSQEAGKGYSKDGVLVTGFAQPRQLVCWNLQYPLESEYVGVLAQNDTTLQYINSVKLITENGCSIEKLSIMSNRFQKYILKTMDFTEVNFRVMTADLNALVKGTVCEPIGRPVVVNSIVEKEYLPLKVT
ncbi:major royal jelly protein 1 isoform X2 [Neodiprion fabricii]|uniref:major royal jelly protein 1 isoform X2 n=1 Tax=Neodiprion fabricii TaxID=2872261 RepID=UPI001ED9840F|nr:major royal jelly protein 1 isoform X2 [Neodiprion fabricii]